MTKPKISKSMKKVQTFKKKIFFIVVTKLVVARLKRELDYGQRLSKTMHRKGHHNDKLLFMIWTKTTGDHDETEDSRNDKDGDKHDEREDKHKS